MKKTYEIYQSLRNTWIMNPVTRIKENEKKNKKKERQSSKKNIKNYYERNLEND
jgi:hypothetical protein